MSIASLKRNRSSAMDSVNAAMNQSKKGQGQSQQDTNLWKPFLDDDKGIGQALIRFLPAPEGEELPFALVYDYGFQGPAHLGSKYYIENSLSTIGQKDAVGEMNNRLWNTCIGDNSSSKGAEGYGLDK